MKRLFYNIWETWNLKIGLLCHSLYKELPNIVAFEMIYGYCFHEDRNHKAEQDTYFDLVVGLLLLVWLCQIHKKNKNMLSQIASMFGFPLCFASICAIVSPCIDGHELHDQSRMTAERETRGPEPVRARRQCWTRHSPSDFDNWCHVPLIMGKSHVTQLWAFHFKAQPFGSPCYFLLCFKPSCELYLDAYNYNKFSLYMW